MLDSDDDDEDVEEADDVNDGDDDDEEEEEDVEEADDEDDDEEGTNDMDGFDCWSHPFSNGRKPNACLIINSIERFLQFVETLLCTNTSERCNYVCQHLTGLFPHLVKPSFSLSPSRFFFSKTGLFVYHFHSAQKHQ